MSTSYNWHMLSKGAVLHRAGVNETRGLTTAEAEKRLAAFGPNKLMEKAARPRWRLFLEQFQDFMVLIMLAAAGISFVLGEKADVLAILAIVFLNAILGYIQEAKAESSLAALKELTAPTSRVIRDGTIKTIKAERLVPGDILLLESGDRVPADVRLLESFSLAVDESPLTGESLPVNKSADWLGKGDEAPGDRRNMLHMGTTVVRGHGRGVVVQTGMSTQIGEIAGLVQESAPGPTPLQVRLEQLGRVLVLVCLSVVLVVFFTGVWQGASAYTMFLTAVSLAVAAIPEGLPAVVTIALAIGVQRMIRRRAIVRRLPAVETLGCATVICSDKTGTLTKNEMTVIGLVGLHGGLKVGGSGYEPKGEFFSQPEGEAAVKQPTSAVRPIDPGRHPDWHMALLISALCNHAVIRRENGKIKPYGDPTEAALAVLAMKAGLDPEQLRKKYPPIAEIPFDAERKRMSVVVDYHGRRSLVKGAPGIILERSTHTLENGRVRLLSTTEKNRLKAKAAMLAGEAWRVLALAYRDLPPGHSLGEPPPEELLERKLVFVALVYMMDPPRPEVRRAVQLARSAGVRTIMVTGDHQETALAVARQLGLAGTGQVLTGEEIDRLDDERLKQLLPKVNVFARVSPRHKLRIVRTLRAMNEVVAMTGDGVNDAPAVKEADIGIAMGQAGTDITKETSSMILADDNYATIVAAIEEGRGIYDNIRKFIRYLLASNTGEVLTMFTAALAGLPLPLLPVQILWMNLVTDGLPAVALGLDPPDKGVMMRPPRRPDEGVFSRRLHWKILLRGLLISFCTLAVFQFALISRPGELSYAQTMAFTTLVTSQLLYVFQCRSEYRSLFEVGLFTNGKLLGAVAVSLAMQLTVIYLPAASRLFYTTPLQAADWALILAAGSWTIMLEGLLRFIRSKVRRHLSLLRVQARSQGAYR